MVRMLSAQTKIPRLRAPFPARPPRRARGQSRFARDDNQEGHGVNAGLKAYSTQADAGEGARATR